MYPTCLPSAKKKRSRESEIALLEKISISLDSYIGGKPPPSSPSGNGKAGPNDVAPRRKRLASDASKSAAKNFLAAKTLAKSIAKACAEEGATANATAGEEKDGGVGVGGWIYDDLIDSLLDEYSEKYPLITRSMIIDGIARHRRGVQVEEATSSGDILAKGDDIELKFGRIIAVVDAEMGRYNQKIQALKRSRERAALDPDPGKPPQKRGRRKRERSGEGGEDVEKEEGGPCLVEANEPDRGAKRPKGRWWGMKEKEMPEDFIMDEILKKYTEERQKYDRVPNGVFERIVEETKRKHRIKSLDIPLNKLDKKIRFKYNKMVSNDEVVAPSAQNNRHRKIVEEIYARYSRTKQSNGAKLKPGTLDAIIEGVRLEYGLSVVDLRSLKTKVQQRFSKENPEFQSNPPTQLKIGSLSQDDKQKRQLLVNEVMAQYIREKDEHPKKLADGTLDRIIEQTKSDLGIHEFEVPKASIRGRIHRKSPHVFTLGNESPYDVIDEPLVATINGWLSQGISVTRAQGLDLANSLLKGEGREKDSLGNNIILDAKWWRNFLERNKRRLVCADN